MCVFGVCVCVCLVCGGVCELLCVFGVCVCVLFVRVFGVCGVCVCVCLCVCVCNDVECGL